MYKKNQICTVTITDLGAEGEGIGKIDGYPLFVKDALPGDVIEARLTKVKKNFAFAKVIKMFSFKTFIVLLFTFTSAIHLELMFIYSVK